MVTGDHPITAQAIAKGVGIIGPSEGMLLVTKDINSLIDSLTPEEAAEDTHNLVAHVPAGSVYKSLSFPILSYVMFRVAQAIVVHGQQLLVGLLLYVLLEYIELLGNG